MFLCHCEERDPAFVIARNDSDEAISRKDRNRLYNLFMEKEYYIYIMTNKNNTVLYTGVTSDLKRRVYEHKEKLTEGFTKKYNATKLVYYEIFKSIDNAIMREKQIGGSRNKKIKLINKTNPDWKDYILNYEIASVIPNAFGRPRNDR